MYKRQSNGEHEITIEVKYKDSLRNDQVITYDTTIFVDTPLIANTGEGDSTIGIAAVVIIIAIIGYVFYKRRRSTVSKTS